MHAPRTLRIAIALCAPLALAALLLLAAPVATADAPARGERVAAAAIVLTKTVGTNGGACATTDTITLPVGGGMVFYCYVVHNVGTITLTRHTLTDDRLGTILLTFSYTLVPGASAFLTVSALITHDTINSATWTSYNPGPIDSAADSDSAKVSVTPTVAALTVTKTVGTHGGICATTDTITLTVPATVFYCYEVTNGGNISLTRHTLVDNRLGTLLTNFPFALMPGASAFLTASALITQTTVNTATWTGYNPGPVNSTSDVDTARVVFQPKIYLPLIRR